MLTVTVLMLEAPGYGLEESPVSLLEYIKTTQPVRIAEYGNRVLWTKFEYTPAPRQPYA